jgi:hypothetical protein
VRLPVTRIDKMNQPTVQDRMIQLAKTDG